MIADIDALKVALVKNIDEQTKELIAVALASDDAKVSNAATVIETLRSILYEIDRKEPE